MQYKYVVNEVAFTVTAPTHYFSPLLHVECGQRGVRQTQDRGRTPKPCLPGVDITSNAMDSANRSRYSYCSDINDENWSYFVFPSVSDPWREILHGFRLRWQYNFRTGLSLELVYNAMNTSQRPSVRNKEHSSLRCCNLHVRHCVQTDGPIISQLN